MSAVIPSEMSRDMGLTLDDFLRSLPSAIEPLTHQRVGRVFTIPHPEGSVVISLGETGERRIASLSLPVTPVRFQFTGLDETARSLFMQRFDRYFQRGGG
ncbi:MAG: hypothetical protein OQL20_02940 [Sedimenticola sp.]|nr:hypothetical protein [Sedimenticola sp.]